MTQSSGCQVPGIRAGCVRRTACTWIALCLAVLWTCSSYAAADDTPQLVLGQPYLRGEDVWLDLSMSAMVRGEVVDALHSGLPATVVFEWRIWHRREGWWDQQVGEGATFYRVFYDVLQNQYDVFDHRGRLVASSSEAQAIEDAISDHSDLKLVTASVLRKEWTYYVEVLARIELLDEDEVRDLKEWLSGSRRKDKGVNVVGTLSEQLGKLLDGIVGPNEKTVVSKTEDFNGF